MSAKKAWELTDALIENAVPELQSEEEQGWTADKRSVGDIEVEETRARWYTRVPGSRAPDTVMLGAIQDTENMGRDVTEAEAMIPDLQRAYDEHDDGALLALSAKLLQVLGQAPKAENHPYWSYAQYTCFADHEREVAFPAAVPVPLSGSALFERLHAAWLAQIAGAGLGTALEGYTGAQIERAFGEVRSYPRKPSTYNDDVLFELAFLEAVLAKGRAVASEDIAMQWLSCIEYTWSAEEAALKNLRRGIFPPESALVNNPWREWIGAQMRGAVCGLVAPGDAKTAARLAWVDGAVSHANNGILGEVFNAMLVSLAFVEGDVRHLLRKTIALLPKKSEYCAVVQFAWEACEAAENWRAAWQTCREKYRRYNWIHAYPNAAAEVVALYFGRESFDECMHISAMCGLDVDCNAGQIGTVYGVMQGYAGVGAAWTAPFGDRFESLYRGYESTTISYLASQTQAALEMLRG